MKTELISCMNNTKWREFFEAIENEPMLSDIPFFIKYLDSEEIFRELLFFGEITETGLFVCWPSLLTRKISEKGNCWTAYKDIEWISLPNVYDSRVYAVTKRNRKLFELDGYMVGRHMVELKSIIEEVGHLTYKFNDTELKLYGYRKIGGN